MANDNLAQPHTIPLTRGKVALVSPEDADRLRGFACYAHKGRRTWYARTEIGGRKNRRRIYMHRMLLGEGDYLGDHVDGNGLNNQRHNLRRVDNTRNLANSRSRGGTSLFKGVSWDPSRQKWKAQIAPRGKNRCIGRYDSEEDAARAYDAEARTEFGRFARLNFPAHE